MHCYLVNYVYGVVRRSEKASSPKPFSIMVDDVECLLARDAKENERGPSETDGPI